MRKHGSEDYRLYPIRLDLMVYGMMPFKPSESYWPKDKPASMLLCTSLSTPSGPEKDNPNVVIVLIAQDVKALLGTPDSWNEKGNSGSTRRIPNVCK